MASYEEEQRPLKDKEEFRRVGCKMEDDKRLDLSLGLPVGRSSSKSNDKSSTSFDASPNGGDRTNKILNDFRNFLNGGIPQQPQGNFFNNFPPSPNVNPPSRDGDPRKFRSSTERPVDLESENAALIAGDKRKHVYEETSSHKKQENDRSSDVHDKGRTSHISITTDDGSTADNEDVAESDAETSRPLTNFAENSKHHVDSLQSITFKDAVSVGPNVASFHPLTGDRAQTLNAGNTSITFGYSNGQLPYIDKDSPWGMAARPPFNPYPSRPLSASGTSHGQSEAKQPAVEEGSSTKVDDHFRVSNSSVIHTENSFPSEYPAIRPGMAAELKFGGSGSLPNLPWVSTTGPGPNGRTISGVTYRFSANQIKVVCACHGLHMSPEEFILHASDEPPSVDDSTAAGSSTGGGGGGSGLASFSGTGNAAASAKS
ncbi:hypothetical protein V2J09_002895 [Rumex salicifolius]